MKLQSVSSHIVFLVFVLSLLVASGYSQGNQFCPLCATQADLPARWDYRLSDGRTCREVYLYLAGISSSNSMCQPTKNMAQQACCSTTAPQTGNSPPTPPAYSGPVGNEPICAVCGTAEYPGIPQAFVVARYVGEFTCHQLYGRGRNGMIPNYMCGPLQDFVKSICGCGQFNPNCQADPSKCWGNPVASPVASPVSQPVTSPVSSPTANGKKNQSGGNKNGSRQSNNRGGSGGALRARRNEEYDNLEEVEGDLQVEHKELLLAVPMKSEE